MIKSNPQDHSLLEAGLVQSPNPLITWLVFLVTSPYVKLSRGPPPSPHYKPKLLSIKTVQRLLKCLPRTKGKHEIYFLFHHRIKHFKIPIILDKILKFRSISEIKVITKYNYFLFLHFYSHRQFEDLKIIIY